MADKTITGIVTWLKGWFYTKDEITTKENALQTQINNKASQSDLNTLSSTVSGKLDASDYVVDSALSSSSTNPVQNKVINTALSNKSDVGHIHDDRYYTESEVDDLLDDKLDSSAYVVDSALSSSSTNPVQNKAINTALNNKANSTHSHTTANVTEASALSNIGTSANASQHTINESIDNIIGNLTGAEIIKVVTTLPTASASTMNALYLLSSNSQYDIYITVESSGSYAWEKLDDDVLSDLSIDWSDILNKPSSFTPSAHNQNDGTILNTNNTFDVLSSNLQNQYDVNQDIDANLNAILNNYLPNFAQKSQVIDWDTLTFVPKADDSTGAITFDYLE